ncbi:hypothetical protein LguiA_027141 [Lonicera macranthoides]
MEGKTPADSSLMPDGLPDLLPLQGSIQVNHQEYLDPFQSFMVYPQQVQAEYPFRAWNMQGSDQMISLVNSINEAERPHSFVICSDVQKGGIEQQECPWKRVKWTDDMVKLLVTAASYVGDDISSDLCGSEKSDFLVIARKGKWRAISKVLVERGCKVSPQQCEDKFNDLNKKYRRLVDILGRGTSCEVVENPELLELMNLCDNLKEEVRKLLSTKQLFYREMCSYHNKNRLFLPHDEGLRQSLRSVMKGKRQYKPKEPYEEDGDSKSEDDKGNFGKLVDAGVSLKRKKQEEEGGVGGFGNVLLDDRVDKDPVSAEGAGGEERLQECWMRASSLRLEKKKLWIQVQMLELKKEQSKWLRICQQADEVLDKMRMENERLKCENERLSYVLKRREISDDDDN